MHKKNNGEDEEELENFSSNAKEIDKASKLALINKKIDKLKAKFPSSLERIFYMSFVK